MSKKFMKGDVVRVVGVQLPSEMGHLIGKEFALTNVSHAAYDDYCYEILDDATGAEWYFTEEQLEFAVKDENYFESEKKKLIAELKLLQDKFEKYHKELLEFKDSRVKGESDASWKI